MFKAGSQIRELSTGKLYLVVQSYKYAVLVLDLNSGSVLNEGKLIAERDWFRFKEDHKCQKIDEYKWEQIQI